LPCDGFLVFEDLVVPCKPNFPQKGIGESISNPFSYIVLLMLLRVTLLPETRNLTNGILRVPWEMVIRGNSTPTRNCKGTCDEKMLNGFFYFLTVWALRRPSYTPLLQIISGEDSPFQKGPGEEIDFGDGLELPNNFPVRPSRNRIVFIAQILVASLNCITRTYGIPSKTINVVFYYRGNVVEMSLKIVKALLEIYGYGREIPSLPNLRVNVPL